MAESIIGPDQLLGIDFDRVSLWAEEEMFPASCLQSDTPQQTSPARSRTQLSRVSALLSPLLAGIFAE